MKFLVIKDVINLVTNNTQKTFFLVDFNSQFENNKEHEEEIGIKIISTEIIEKLTKLKGYELKILIGSRINVKYYSKGALMPSGERVNFRQTKLKAISFQYSGSIEQMRIDIHKNIEIHSNYKIIPDLLYYDNDSIEEEYQKHLILNKIRLRELIHFGKYKGITLEKIIHEDCAYVFWAIVNDYFLIHESDFIFLDTLIDSRIAKLLISYCYGAIDEYMYEQQENFNPSADYYDFGRDVLDGDLEAYWNID